MDKIFISNLDIDITQNCTMSCTECTKLVPAFKGTEQKEISPETLFNDLSNLAQAATFQWGQLLGGEPMLHSDVLECIKAVRNSKISEKILITTNGTLFEKFTDEIIDSIDMVRMSVYPGKIPLKLIEDFEKRLKSRGKFLDQWHQNNFIPVFSKDPVKSIDLAHCAERNFSYCEKWMCKCFTYSDNYICSCPTAYAINKFLKNDHADGIFLGDKCDEKDLKNKLLLEATKEYKACKNCLRSVNIEKTAWSECTKKIWYEKHSINQ